MTASVARASPAPFIYFRPERSPFIIKQAQSVAGRLAMLFLAGALLRPFTELWIVTVLAAAGASFTSRRYGPAVTALATLAAFALAPNWYGLKAPMAFAHNAGLTDWLTPELRWGPPAIVLAFAALFLGAVRSGRATFIARHPISSLLGVFAALVVAAIEAPLGPEFALWMWSIASAFGIYLWLTAIVAIEQRSPSNRVPFWQMLAPLHPFWSSTAAAITMGPRKLVKMSALDEEALAISQIKGLKLIIWGTALLLAAGAFASLVHTSLGVPPVHDAVVAEMGPGIAWSMRWICLISRFFEAILDLAATTHIVVGSARLCGYKLLRNTYRPLSSRSIAEFWNRYFYYFKELLVHLFYFPAYLGYFKSNPRLRAAFATFMAAGVGNALFHFVRQVEYIAGLGFWRALIGYQTYAFYCFVLATGIIISQMMSGKKAYKSTLFGKGVTFVTVMGFFCLLQVFEDSSRDLSLGDHIGFFVSLFQI